MGIVVTPKPTPKPYTNSAQVQANVDLGKRIGEEKGIIGKQWDCFYGLGMEESGWKHTADNPTSTAYGIPQALPGSKMKTHGDIHDPEVQIRWMIDYVKGRYGTMCQAYHFQLSHNWY